MGFSYGSMALNVGPPNQTVKNHIGSGMRPDFGVISADEEHAAFFLVIVV